MSGSGVDTGHVEGFGVGEVGDQAGELVRGGLGLDVVGADEQEVVASGRGDRHCCTAAGRTAEVAV